MSISVGITGALMGLGLAAPVGPIGLLCIRRSLTGGMLLGFATGMGAAVADALYGCIAGFGLTAITDFLLRYQLWLSLLGGIFLGYLGWRIVHSAIQPATTTAPTDVQTDDPTTGIWLAFGSTFLLTLANPMTIVTFLALFVGSGSLRQTHGVATAAWLVAGVLVGSLLWWLLLSGTAAAFRKHVTSKHLRWVNYASGLLLMAFGLWQVLQGLGLSS